MCEDYEREKHSTTEEVEIITPNEKKYGLSALVIWNSPS